MIELCDIKLKKVIEETKDSYFYSQKLDREIVHVKLEDQIPWKKKTTTVPRVKAKAKYLDYRKKQV